MALNATLFRFHLNISDLNRHYYDSVSLQVAQHPSETPQRMLLRLLAYVLNAAESLSFTKGLSTTEEPDLWQKNLSGEIEHWIELGTPDSKRIRRALGQARQVTIFAYGGQDLQPWWQSVEAEFRAKANCAAWQLFPEQIAPLVDALNRNMELSAVIDGDDITLTWQEGMLTTTFQRLDNDGVRG